MAELRFFSEVPDVVRTAFGRTGPCGVGGGGGKNLGISLSVSGPGVMVIWGGGRRVELARSGGGGRAVGPSGRGVFE